MVHSSMLRVSQRQIKEYKNLIRVFDISDYKINVALNLMEGCYIVCISRNSYHRVNGFYMVNPKTGRQIVCIGTRADDILNAYSFPELIDLPQEA